MIAEPHRPDLSHRRAAILLLALGLLAFIAGLGSRGLWIPDETRYALVARDMIDSGDWLHLKLVGRPYPDKPVGCFWIIGAVAKTTGLLNEWTVRIPSALAGVGCLMLVAAFGRRLFDARTGFLASVILGTTGSVVISARSFMFDMPLTFWILAATALLWKILSEDRQRLWIPFGLLCGLGILTKGHNGLLLPVLTGLAYSAWERRWRPWRGFPLALAACLATAALWLGPAVATLGAEEGKVFLNDLVFRQGLKRFSDPEDHLRPFYWYFEIYPLLLFPWVIHFPRALVDACRSSDDRSPRRRFLAAWILAVFVFFSLSKSKGYFYLLPTLPAAALLIAEHLDRRFRRAASLLPVIQHQDTKTPRHTKTKNYFFLGGPWWSWCLGVWNKLSSEALDPETPARRRLAAPPLLALAALTLTVGGGGVVLARVRAPDLLPMAAAVTVAALFGAVATVTLWRRAPALGSVLAPALASALVLGTFLAVAVPALDPVMCPRDLVRRTLDRLPPGGTFTAFTVDRRYFEIYAPRDRFTPPPGDGTSESFVKSLRGRTLCLIEAKTLPQILKWGRWEVRDSARVRFEETWLLVEYFP